VQAQLKLDSLLQAWNNTQNHDTIRLKAIEGIYGTIYTNSNPDSVLYYADLAYNFASKKKLLKNVSNALYASARASFFKGYYAKSIEKAKESYAIKEKINDKIGMGRCLNMIANVYKDQGNNAKAMEYYTRSLKIREAINDKVGMAGTYNNIGNIYGDQMEYEKALSYYQKALKTAQESKNEGLIAAAYSSLGDAYALVGDTLKAIDCLNQSVVVLEKVNANRDLAVTLVSIGNMQVASKNYTTAIENYNKAFILSKNTGDSHVMAMCNSGLGDIEYKQGNYKKAIEYYQKALVIAQEVGIAGKTKSVSESLYKSYKKLGSYKDALDMHELFILTRDSILSETNQKEVMSQELKYNYEKKSLADSLEFINKKKIDDLKHEAELKVEQNQRYALYGGLSLVIIFSLFIFNRFKVTQKQKKIIEHQKHQIVESINYSKKIQDSLLPPISKMQELLPDLFVFYKPKDIVSGDFYWYKNFEDFTLIACVDCTGHGVPGGFMSTMGNLLLDKVASVTFNSTGEILSNLSNEIIRVLNQQNGGEIQDGMDLSICLIDKKNKKVEFSGARNGIIIVSGGKAVRYKADLLPVGGNYIKKDKPLERVFKSQTIELKPNDWLYMYTDGFMEQVGGNENLPMNYTQFETVLIDAAKIKSIDEKINHLSFSFNKWKNSSPQDDDILILGFTL